MPQWRTIENAYKEHGGEDIRLSFLRADSPGALKCCEAVPRYERRARRAATLYKYASCCFDKNDIYRYSQVQDICHLEFFKRFPSERGVRAVSRGAAHGGMSCGTMTQAVLVAAGRPAFSAAPG